MKPRERLLDRGPQSLTDQELIAILLRTGVSDQDVVSLAESLLSDCGGLSGLFDMSVQDMLQVRGIGEAKATSLAAVMELARRYFVSKLNRNDNRFHSPDHVYQYLRHAIPHDGSERFCVLFLDPQGRLIQMDEMFRGNHSAAPVFVSEIMKRCLTLGASDMIVAHNHPSGNTTPSPEDRRLTERLQQAARLLDISVRDHVIFSVDGYRSMAEAGEL